MCIGCSTVCEVVRLGRENYAMQSKGRVKESSHHTTTCTCMYTTRQALAKRCKLITVPNCVLLWCSSSKESVHNMTYLWYWSANMALLPNKL